MSRFLVAPEDIQGKEVRLSEEEAHHLTHVLRFREEDTVVVFDGFGNEYLCRIETLHKKECRLRVLEKLPKKPASVSAVTLAHAVTRAERFDWVVEKATELGVAEIIPFACERIAFPLDAKTKEKKGQRWQKLAQAAAKQCGRSDVPAVRPVVPLEELLKQFPQYDWVLLAYELEDKSSLKKALRGELEKKEVQNPKILAVVGPEGGFSAGEVKNMAAAGARSVSLGPNILRTETAAVAMVAMIGYELS